MTDQRRLKIQTRKQRNCCQLFFLYKAFLVNMDLNAMEFTFKAGLFNRNLAMLHDKSGEALQGRISDEIPDIWALIEWHKHYIRQLSHVTETYTVGSSAGGYAALLLGHHVEVDEVWSFAPFTLANDDLASRWEGIAPEHRDLSLLLANWNNKTRFNIYYCVDNKRDRREAERMADCPGVVLHPLPGDDHIAVNVLQERGELDTLFPPLKGV